LALSVPCPSRNVPGKQDPRSAILSSNLNQLANHTKGRRETGAFFVLSRWI
jgi:hypothetical protein